MGGGVAPGGIGKGEVLVMHRRRVATHGQHLGEGLHPKPEPKQEGERGDRHHAIGEIARDGVGEALDRGFTGLGIFDHADDPGDRRVLAHPGGLQGDRPRLHQRSGAHRVTRLLQHRQRFPGQHRLVHGGLPANHRAVHGDPITRQHLQPLPDRHLLHRDVLGGEFQGRGGRAIARGQGPRPDGFEREQCFKG